MRRLSKVRIQSRRGKALHDCSGLRVRQFLLTRVGFVEIQAPKTCRPLSSIAWSLDIPESGAGNPEATAALRRSSERRM